MGSKPGILVERPTVIAWTMAWPTSIPTELIVFKVKIGPCTLCLSAVSLRKPAVSIEQALAFRRVNVGKFCLLRECYSN
jgi:hypothetical protein